MSERREIKFRARDRINKRWINLWQFLFSITGEVMAVKELHGEQYGLHQVDIMQFTGLKDKNGKEIYEGDIVLSDPCDGGGTVGGKRKYAIEYIGERFDFAPKKYSSGELGGPVWGLLSAVNEVIGNIYENPELLETHKSG